MKHAFIVLVLFYAALAKGQTVANGDFSSAATGWGCSPETNPENVYGGGTSNTVAEVDEQAGLCQTISGFVIGNVYSLSLDYSRRTGGCPGPNPAAATVSLSNNALTATVSSNVAAYSLQNSSFTFTATQTTLNLTIAANFVGTTCGLIIDNVVINPYSSLPIELLYFKATADQHRDVLEWSTASQTNNDFFTIERSADAMSWQNIVSIPGAGNSLQTIYYSKTMDQTLNGIYYYRLKQTDYNKRVSYSATVALERPETTPAFFPNPASDKIYLLLSDRAGASVVSALSATGSETFLQYTLTDSGILIDASPLGSGVYVFKLSTPQKNYQQRLVIRRN